MILEAKFEESNHEMNSAMGISFGGGGSAIDDSKVSASTTWSSKNIIEKLCPSINESGAVVACEPFEGLPFEVVSHIVPKQAGSGDPSLTNIRPIIGYDSIKLSRTGENLWDFKSGVSVCKCINASGADFSRFGYIVELPPGTYTVSAEIVTAGDYIYFNLINLDTLVMISSAKYLTTGDTAYSQTITLQERQGLFVYNAGYDNVNNDWQRTEAEKSFYEKVDIQIVARTAAPPYEPYRGNTFTIDLGQTVYGGTFNWKTGELTIDRETIVYDGVNNCFFGIDIAAGSVYAAATLKPAASQLPMCSHLKSSINYKYGEIYIAGINLDTFLAYIQPFADVQEANAWLAEQYANGTPFTVCYELRYPITVQLTPQEISALVGTNNIFGNTGDTEVSRKAYTQAVIQDIYDKLNALSATLTALTGV